MLNTIGKERALYEPQFPVTFLTRCQPHYIYCITRGRPEKSKQLQQSPSISTIANIASY